MSTGLKANSDGSAAIQVGGTDVITLTSGGAATFVTSPTTVQAGTAAAPSITFSGDTNTGIYSPGADTIAFTEGGVESMRINSSGQVGIGTTSPGYPLHVSSSGNNTKARFTNGTTTLDLYCGGTEVYTGTANSATAWAYDNSNTYIAGFVNSSEKIRITSSGNVGIGTSSPGNKLSIQQSANNIANGMLLINAAGTENGGWYHGGSSLVGREGGIDTIHLAAGEVYIAGTTDQGAYNLQVNGTGVWGAGAYVNGSDARIKEDVAPIESGLDVVTRLNPVTYRYKEDWSKDQSIQTGFIAQELLVAMEGQNYVDGVVQQGGSEGYYSVAYQNIIPLLTKAIQELKAELDATKAEVAALKGAA